MTEDQLRTLFGEIQLVPVLLWLFALFTFLGVVIGAIMLLWKKITVFVSAVNLIVNLDTRLSGIDETLERVRAQVENSHTTNMREENDERHAQIVDELKGIKKDIGRLDTREIALAQDISTVRRDLAEHVEWSRSQEDRIDGLEDTLNPKEKP